MNNSLNLKAPNFFIPGSPKAGTTALVFYLQQHPDVYMSHPKEPNFFNTDFSKAHRRFFDFSDYINTCFGEAGKFKIRGEATVWYLYSQTAIEKILAFNEKAKFIVMLRNPVDLVYSLHSTLLRSVQEDVTEFEEAWNLIETRKKGEQIPVYCRDSKLLFYDEIASQGAHIEMLLGAVDKSQVHFVFFDDFQANTQKEYLKCLDFLGLDPQLPRAFEVVNENYEIKSRTLGLIAGKIGRSNTLYKIKRALGIPKGKGPLKLIHRLNKKVTSRTSLQDNFREHLRDYFLEDICKIELLLSVDLSHWKSES